MSYTLHMPTAYVNIFSLPEIFIRESSYFFIYLFIIIIIIIKTSIYNGFVVLRPRRVFFLIGFST